MTDLEQLRLRITDYSKTSDLADAIGRYFALLRLTFDSTSIYKVFETPKSQIYRFLGVVQQVAAPAPGGANIATIQIQCSKCKQTSQIQANLDESSPIREGALPFPADNKFTCPQCGSLIDLTDARRQIEVQSKKRVV
jgi:hypothetical protein